MAGPSVGNLLQSQNHLRLISKLLSGRRAEVPRFVVPGTAAKNPVIAIADRPRFPGLCEILSRSLIPFARQEQSPLLLYNQRIEQMLVVDCAPVGERHLVAGSSVPSVTSLVNKGFTTGVINHLQLPFGALA